MLKLYKSGISLIVLVITIIVIIILSGAVLLSLVINNPIGQAVKATFLNDVSAFQSELNTYTSSQYTNTLGSFDPTRLQADENSLTYMGTVDTSKTINDIIPSLNQNEKYADSFEIINGRIAKITPNTNSSYITGGGTGTTYISSGTQSTTGNVYGIYDMSGGNWEFVAALPSNNNYNITSNASALMNADVKYRDMYIASPDNESSNYANAATKYGDAIYETSSSYQGETSWYGGYSYMIYGSQITFVRGGVAMGSTYSNQFATNVYSGSASSVHGFRPALAVASGL